MRLRRKGFQGGDRVSRRFVSVGRGDARAAISAWWTVAVSALRPRRVVRAAAHFSPRHLPSIRSHGFLYDLDI